MGVTNIKVIRINFSIFNIKVVHFSLHLFYDLRSFSSPESALHLVNAEQEKRGLGTRMALRSATGNRPFHSLSRWGAWRGEGFENWGWGSPDI